MKSATCASAAARAPEGLQGRDRGVAQLARAPARRGKSGGRGVGGLLERGIRAGGLAEQRRIAFHIEDVILDLEGEADVGPETLERRELGARGEAGRQRPEQHAALDQRSGLAPVHLLDLRDRELPSDGGQVDRLPAGHAAGAGGPGEHADHLQARAGGGLAEGLVGEHGKGQRLQRVPDQHRGALVVGAVAGRAPAAQVIVVHRRQVIVDEAVDVDQFHRGGRRIEGLARPPPGTRR